MFGRYNQRAYQRPMSGGWIGETGSQLAYIWQSNVVMVCKSGMLPRLTICTTKMSIQAVELGIQKLSGQFRTNNHILIQRGIQEEQKDPINFPTYAGNFKGINIPG